MKCFDFKLCAFMCSSCDSWLLLHVITAVLIFVVIIIVDFTIIFIIIVVVVIIVIIFKMPPFSYNGRFKKMCQMCLTGSV